MATKGCWRRDRIGNVEYDEDDDGYEENDVVDHGRERERLECGQWFVKDWVHCLFY